jgi:hypothetical protein
MRWLAKAFSKFDVITTVALLAMPVVGAVDQAGKAGVFQNSSPSYAATVIAGDTMDDYVGYAKDTMNGTQALAGKVGRMVGAPSAGTINLGIGGHSPIFLTR